MSRRAVMLFGKKIPRGGGGFGRSYVRKLPRYARARSRMEAAFFMAPFYPPGLRRQRPAPFSAA